MNSRSQSKLPFLLRIHSGHFHICLGLCSQTVLWKTLEENPLSFIRFPFKIPSHFTFGLWLLALLGFLVISGAYLSKCVFHFETVRMEYFNRVRVNYFFVPWIAGMLLRLGLPSNIAPDNVHPVVCCIFMVPIAVLELKIYGQWFTKVKRSLARVANPSTHLSVIGNFMIARIATEVEWKEIAFFFFTVGIIHYAVVFITLYQRLSSDITASRKICPVFFLFIAAPSSASVAWKAISGSFDTFSMMLLFLTFLVLGLDNENRFLPRQHTEIFNDLVGMRISNYDNVSSRTKVCREREASHCSYIGLCSLFDLHGNDINSCTVNYCQHGSG
ncbi:guard cell S-type anion channel SLAC1-like [Cryptomeria japonica]|uniref:guard cell S-type anion channel SLAC1-like n=1 Tax=Cryptomeria japonica TaxID=3369 RepID=UPI0025AD737B|nr:guard cell S-type anion channel SLAC1-like [Cryptomeria japonica]